MLRHLRPAALVLAAASLAPSARGADLLVDASGAGGAFVTLDQAMVAASPGDRLLVMPGTYGAFQWSRGVSVIGLGSSPSQVVIQGIAYHVSVPVLDYDTLLSNVTVDSPNPQDTLVVSGNELPPGTFVIDGCVLRGGVFLRGGSTGFYLMISNTTITGDPGDGFGGALVRVGGANNWVELRNATVRGPDADPNAFAPATAGVLVAKGTRMKAVNSVIAGGDGAAGVAFYADAASALIEDALPGTTVLRLDGGVTLLGGAGAPGGAGGDGATFSGVVELGTATVTGGAGSPAGAGLTAATVLPLPAGLHLGIAPSLRDGAAPVFLTNGDVFTFQFGAPANRSLLVLAFDLDVPVGGLFVPVAPPMLFVPGNGVQLQVPVAPSVSLDGVHVFAQGFTQPEGQKVFETNTAVVRLDLK